LPPFIYSSIRYLIDVSIEHFHVTAMKNFDKANVRSRQIKKISWAIVHLEMEHWDDCTLILREQTNLRFAVS
jgi:hypothetical protein